VSPGASEPPTPPPPAERGLLWPVLGAVVVTLLVRALVALSRLDELELERYGGSIAWLLLHGQPLEPTQLPIIPHLRGSFVFGLLTVPALLLLGPTLIAVKSVALLWSALSAGLLAAVAGRAFGRPAAWFAGLWLALAPPAFQRVDVLALGSHADTLPLLLAPLLLLLGPGIDAERGTSRRSYLALGTLLGFGLFFSMQLWVAMPALLAAWWVRDRRFALRPGVLLAALAAAPWLALIPVLTPKATLVNKPLAERFAEGGLGAMLGKFWRAVTSDLPRSWLFAESGVAFGTYVLGLACLGALLSTLWRLPWKPLRPRGGRWSGADTVRLFCLLHLLGLFGAYASSDFNVNLRATADGMGSRYFLPLLPALALLLCSALVALRGGRGRRLAVPAQALLLGTGLLGLWPLLDPRLGLEQPPVQAAELYLALDHLHHAAGPDLAARLALIDELDPHWGVLRALAYDQLFVEREQWSREELIAELQRAAAGPAALQPFRFAALGIVSTDAIYDQLAIASRPGSEIRERLLEHGRTAIELLDGEAEGWFLRGYGRQLTASQSAGVMPAINELGGSAAESVAQGFRLVTELPPEVRPTVMQGMGFQVGLRATVYERVQRELLNGAALLPRELQEHYFLGFAWGFRLRFLEPSFDPAARLSIRELVPEHGREAFERGLRWSGPPPAHRPAPR
jgi:4-amino-4-deoxy-L-arabinose transferase-like glycosyltransferase